MVRVYHINLADEHWENRVGWMGYLSIFNDSQTENKLKIIRKFDKNIMAVGGGGYFSLQSSAWYCLVWVRIPFEFNWRLQHHVMKWLFSAEMHKSLVEFHFTTIFTKIIFCSLWDLNSRPFGWKSDTLLIELLGWLPEQFLNLVQTQKFCFFIDLLWKCLFSVLLKFKTTRQAVYSSESPPVAAQY